MIQLCRKSVNSHMKRRLCVAADMSNNAFENLWLVWRRSPQFRIEVLKLDLLATEVIREATKSARLIFLASFVGEHMALYALPHSV